MNFSYLLVMVLSTSEPSIQLIDHYPDLHSCKIAIVEKSERRAVELRCMKIELTKDKK